MVKRLFLIILILLACGCTNETSEIKNDDEPISINEEFNEESRESVLINSYKNQLFLILNILNENDISNLEYGYGNRLISLQETMDDIYLEYKDIILSNSGIMLLDEDIFFLISYLQGINTEHECVINDEELELIVNIFEEIDNNITRIEKKIKVEENSNHSIGDYEEEYTEFIKNYKE